MRNIKLFTFTFLVLAFVFSCSSADTNNADNGDTTEMASGDKKNNKPKKKGKGKKKGPRVSTNEAYWASMTTDSGLAAEQVKSLREIDAKYSEQIRAIVSEKKEGYEEARKELRIKQKEEVKKLLGEELYQKKLAWDKEWRTRKQK